MLGKYSPQFFETIKTKTLILTLLVLLSFLIIIIRLWYIQIIKGDYFATLSENNRIRLVRLPDYRGRIFDRKKRAIVGTRPSFNVYLTPEDAKDVNKVIEVLQTVISLKQEEILNKIKLIPPFQDLLIKRDIDRDTLAFIEENRLILPGISIKVESIRDYIYGHFASHLIGYIGEIGKKQLKLSEFSEYSLGDLIGQYGVEKIFETTLRGKKGGKQIEVDAAGRELNILNMIEPKPGMNIILTIDMDVQKKAEELLIGKVGAVVAMDPTNGEIIALASSPSFDPNIFAGGISRHDWGTLIKDPFHPLSNRTIHGQYPPGSTYKLIVATSALSEGLINEYTILECPGFFKMGNKVYRCWEWKRKGHGRVNLKRAIIESCDVFFYQTGLRVGINKIKEYASLFGLGNITQIGLEGEKPGLIPTTDWKKQVKKEPWVLGETISASIGQGFDLVTPLQMAVVISAFANKGTIWKPRFIDRIENNKDDIISTYFSSSKQSSINPKVFQLINEALLGVVNDPRGTGKRARIDSILVAGKTGTSQVVKLKSIEGMEEKDLPYEYKDHAWFISYAPYESPRIAVSVLIEHGEHGGSTAAPIAKEVIKAYLEHYQNIINVGI